MYTPTPELGHDTDRVLPRRRDLRADLLDSSTNSMRGGTAMSNFVGIAASGPDLATVRQRVAAEDAAGLGAEMPAVAGKAAASGTRPGSVRTGGIMLVGSSGGHLAQLLALEPWWALKDRHWVTFPTPDAESLLEREHVTWAHYPTTRNVPNLLRNTRLAVRTLLRRRPDAIVSTGAGVALPFFVFGRLLGIPTIYIEVFDRIDSRTLTARLCAPFTTTLLVQWEEQRALYPHATLVGTLL